MNDSFLPALFIGVVQVLFLGWCGLGVVRLFSPPRLHHHTLTLAPIVGLALLALVGYAGSHLGLTMRTILPFVLIGTTGVLLFSFIRPRRDYPEASRWRIGILPLPELIPLCIIMLATWLLSIGPVLGYGALLPIGHNWDVEFYLPLADYLKDYSYATLAQAPANPLRDLLLTERIVARAMGATYAQSMADLLVFRDAWDTWVPMLATLRALSLAGLYALVRVGLGMRAGGGLVGAALVGANSVLLWTTYNSFGMSLGGLALLATALLFTILFLEEGRWGTLILGMFLLCGLIATYWPMLMAYGAAGLAIGITLLVRFRNERAWVRVAGRGALLLIASGLLTLPIHLRASDAFLGVFSEQVASMGIVSYLAPTAIAGSAPFSHRLLPPSPGWLHTLEVAGLVAAILLLGVGVWRGVLRRGLTGGIVLCLIVYLLGLRFVVQFPYGYLRGVSYVNGLLLVIVGAGVFPLPAKTTNNIPWFTRIIPIATTFLLIVLAASNLYAITRTYDVYAQKPGVFDLDSARMRSALASQKQPGAVIVSPAPELRGPTMGALAYLLREREMIGVTTTGYRLFANTPSPHLPVLGVFHRGDDPREYGMDERIWQGERVALYRSPPDRIAWSSGRPTFVTEGALLAENTNYHRTRIGTGHYLEATPTMPLVITFPTQRTNGANAHERGARGSEENQANDVQTITLALASLVSQTIEIEIEIEAEPVTITQHLSAGISHVRITVPASLSRVSLRGRSEPIWLRWWSIEQSPSSSQDQPDNHTFEQSPTVTTTPFSDTMLIQIGSIAGDQGAETTLRIANPSGEVVRLALEIYEDIAGYGGTPYHDAWSLFAIPPEGMHHLSLDLPHARMTLNGQPLVVQTGGEQGGPDGHYFAALWIYQGEQVRRMLPFLHFTRHQGEVQQLTPHDLNVAFVRLNEPETVINRDIGDAVTLGSYAVGAGRTPAMVHPGEDMRVSLLWKTRAPQDAATLVFVQVLDETDRKIADWNGAVGGEWWPGPAWQPGQRIWQDIPLTIAPDAPAGCYRVVMGLFNAETGERVMADDGSTMLTLGTVGVTTPCQ